MKHRKKLSEINRKQVIKINSADRCNEIDFRFGWFWLDLVGFGWVWLDLVGFGRV